MTVLLVLCFQLEGFKNLLSCSFFALTAEKGEGEEGGSAAIPWVAALRQGAEAWEVRIWHMYDSHSLFFQPRGLQFFSCFARRAEEGGMEVGETASIPWVAARCGAQDVETWEVEYGT